MQAPFNLSEYHKETKKDTAANKAKTILGREREQQWRQLHHQPLKLLQYLNNSILAREDENDIKCYRDNDKLRSELDETKMTSMSIKRKRREIERSELDDETKMTSMSIKRKLREIERNKGR